MAPIGSEHAATTDILNELVARALADGRVQVRIQGPLRLDRRNEPQPDLMLLRPRPDRYRSGHPTAADVLLLVEVADSSLAYDRGPKLALYARHGVPEVWLVDLVGRAVEICREPGPEATPSAAGSAKGWRRRRWSRSWRSISRRCWLSWRRRSVCDAGGSSWRASPQSEARSAKKPLRAPAPISILG